MKNTETNGSFNDRFEHLMALEVKDLTLKFLFDHVRNYGIAASVMAAGFYFLKSESILHSSFLMPEISGVILLIIGFILLTLNLIQPIWAMVKFKVKMLPYMIFSMLLYFVALDLFWSFIQRFQSV